jgi:hypothetical protein
MGKGASRLARWRYSRGGALAARRRVHGEALEAGWPRPRPSGGVAACWPGQSDAQMGFGPKEIWNISKYYQFSPKFGNDIIVRLVHRSYGGI